MNAWRIPIVLLWAGLAVWIMGCTATTRDISPEATLHYDESYDFSDKNRIVTELVDPLISHPPFPSTGQKPVVIVYGIANRTDEHIDTSGISDDIRLALLNSGGFRFVNESQRENIARETAYQYSGAVAAETRIQRGRQLGAQYMLTGTLRSIEKKEPKQVRLKKKTLKYYSLNLELTDLKTGLIDWAHQVEIAREASKPIIGW